MNLNISQDNLYLLLPGKVTTLAQFYAEDHHCSLLEALRKVYTSALYSKLANERTKFWHLSARDLYREL